MQKIMKENKKKYLAGGIVLLIIIILVILYSIGYRIRNNFTIGKIGYVTMTIPLPDTSVFIDESDKVVTSQKNEVVRIPFSPNKHSVIVSHDLYYPWKKDFDVPSADTLELFPIFISSNASGILIPTGDPEYWKIRNSITNSSMPTKENPLISKNGKTLIWIENNTILAKINDEIQTVVQPQTKIKNLNFYKERQDAVVFSTGADVDVIEIDNPDNQNFMPIYRGTDPAFVIGELNFIYVLDGRTLMQVTI